jgi:cysteine desulfurase/selenocysteine lyase
MIDIEKVRKDTEVTRQYAYFDSGAASPPPRPVIDTVKAYLDATGEVGPYLPSLRKSIYERVEQIRAGTAQFLGASPAEIAFAKNGSEAISIVAQGISFQTGDEIIVPDTEMLSNLAPWLLLAERKGVVIVKARADTEGLLSVECVAPLISPRTKLLTFCSLSNATGALQPAQALCALARDYGVLSLVNASQSVGLIATDVRQLGCDFLSACGRKGLRAIEGSGILYVREELIAGMAPCLIGWWNAGLDPATQSLTLPPTARRFEAGCPNVPAILALGAALEYTNALEIEAVEKRVRHLTRHLVTRLNELPGINIYGPGDVAHRLGLVPFNIEGVDPQALVVMLEKGKVIIEAGHFMAHPIMRHYRIERMGRISLHYFNTETEIDRMVKLVRDYVK